MKSRSIWGQGAEQYVAMVALLQFWERRSGREGGHAKAFTNECTNANVLRKVPRKHEGSGAPKISSGLFWTPESSSHWWKQQGWSCWLSKLSLRPPANLYLSGDISQRMSWIHEDYPLPREDYLHLLFNINQQVIPYVGIE